MDNKEMLYEISLKYNTLKMYENTIEQMKKNGNTGETLANVELEKNAIEKEFMDLLAFNIDSTVENENKFLKEINKNCKYKELYNPKRNFYDDIKLNKFEENINDKKPTYSDVQEKISNSQWISRSNFIVRFLKDYINIDEWRVSSFFYREDDNILSVTVNDFSEKNEDGTYNVLMKTVSNLKDSPYAGDIYIDVINNSGDLLYRMIFENCEFMYDDCDGFTYESSELRKVILNFNFKDLYILSPDETAY